MQNKNITDTIEYIGVNDREIDLFEGQYVVPNGVSYNSYVIHDEKIVVMDTVDVRKVDDWFANLVEALGGREIDYLVVSHMEPDHAGSVNYLAAKYPNMKLVGNEATFAMIRQFFDLDFTERAVIVKEGDTLPLGKHTLQFFMAPMVHWPEVMVTYEKTEKILFSADGFGKFGDMNTDEEWDDEARRYYINIVGKYGVQVQALLKKASGLDIQMICPLHGPILRENLSHYVGKYDIWSRYQPEEAGVLIAYASIYGNTAKAADKLRTMLLENGAKKVVVADLARDDMSWAVSEAFRYSHLLLAGATYDCGVLPCMDDFLAHLKSKRFQKRKVALLENGTWTPLACKHMRAFLEKMKDIQICDTTITIKSSVKEDDLLPMKQMVSEFWNEKMK